tara:strand:+ start:137 stop:655 length:519 start_codon:yes stop_codon:yes gene_type:complete
MKLNDFYYLGKITKKFSFRGEVIIFLDTDSPEFYYNIKKIFINLNNVLTPFDLSSVIPNKSNRIRVKINGINTENDTKKLINKEIYLPIESLPKTDENSFYYHEIIGYTVLDQDSKKVGNITGVNDQSPQHLFQINASGKKTLIPINDNLIIKVDKKNKTMRIELPDGILDL